jgi:hypothetical protein
MSRLKFENGMVKPRLCVLYKCICIFEVQADEWALVQFTQAGHIVGDHAAFFFGAGRGTFTC